MRAAIAPRPVSVIKRGDVAKGFAEADVVLEETYRTSCEMHTRLEVHGSVARWDGDQLTVWDSNPGPFAIQTRRWRAALRMPLEQGAGDRAATWAAASAASWNSKYTVIAALLARKTGAPGEAVPDPGRDVPVRRQPARPHA